MKLRIMSVSASSLASCLEYWRYKVMRSGLLGLAPSDASCCLRLSIIVLVKLFKTLSHRAISCSRAPRLNFFLNMTKVS
eukprot:CAMPEP_0205826264 /NCGR_PEP_ID=MMETSP0206-20130828/28153_1 /ASSEMBLY_ACC=CAM_ASM_000279 /TAXON_ID=36767 /ORGANISM="Euplotes focardii, Strain TN1" /LENGTH=78 /DNA_ID=CAMNT_0053126055 /DNA_START=238 /DNA_END=474 /DNA_ORIENTATION=-